MMNRSFLTDNIIELRLKKVERKYWVFPVVYQYDIYLQENGLVIGRCDYRCLHNAENYYAGNIGYMIFPEFRGNGYAFSAAKLLCYLARSLGAKKLYITCSPENIASKKTIEKLPIVFIEEVNVPIDHFLYGQGEKIKDIYLLRL